MSEDIRSEKNSNFSGPSVRDNKQSRKHGPRVAVSFYAQIIFLVTLPFLSILGTQILLSFQSSTILLVLIPLVAVVPILVAFDKISTRLLPLAIFCTALSLLYATSLSSVFLRGSDIQREYYFANLVKTSSFWNPTISDSFNSVLSVVMLAPVLSTVSGVPLLWVFKVVYPLLFSLVPLILYQVFQEQTDAKTAFLAVFFFISVFTFYTEMVGIARQQIAEIFVALSLLLIIRKKASANSRTIALLLMIFGALIVLSHYALASIFIGFSVFVWLLYHFAGARFAAIKFKLRKDSNQTNIEKSAPSSKRAAVTTSFVVFCSVIAFVWFIFTANSFTFDNIVHIVSRILGAAITEFLNPRSSQGLSLLLGSRQSLLHEITKYLNILMELFVALGLLAVVLGWVKSKFDYEYLYFSFAAFILLMAGIALPFLASSINTTRLNHISMIFLAPFCIEGIIIAYGVISRSRVKGKGFISKTSALKICAVILFVFLLFNTGFMYALANNDKSIANPNWAITNGSARDRIVLYNSYIPSDEVASAKWVSEDKNNSARIYSDAESTLMAYGMVPMDELTPMYKIGSQLGEGSYVYLRALNIVDGLMGTVTTPQGLIVNSTTVLISSLNGKADAVYSSGGSAVYYTPYTITIGG